MTPRSPGWGGDVASRPTPWLMLQGNGGVSMITLNRLGHSDEPFHLNTDMIVTVESTPDTVITLATGVKVVVAETPAEVAAAVQAYRATVLGEALRRRGTPQRPAPLAQVPREPPRLSAVEDEPT
jgi:flagellar protein FlbD